jgi:DNA mismatch endonuclease (patch repair protein)
MVDRISEKHRSWNMSRIRGKDTKPEKAVRSLLHRMGYRFRLHRKDLPGRPDIVLPSRKSVVMVHGCFWHRHPGCKLAYSPKSRVEFWEGKFAENVERDGRKADQLSALGWKVIVVWECELQDVDALAERLKLELN